MVSCSGSEIGGDWEKQKMYARIDKYYIKSHFSVAFLIAFIATNISDLRLHYLYTIMI